MLVDRIITVTVTNSNLKWYKQKGYEIPIEKVQLYCKNKKGEQIKNGVEERVRIGTKIQVKSDDLPPSSNVRVQFKCGNCGKIGRTRWMAYLNKKTDLCKACESRLLPTKTGSHAYWFKKLISDNHNAKCDVSGETDKRFLVLHHLLSRSNGGKNEESNYVVLSANYHMAFHNWNGGMNVPCTPEQFYEFKKIEISNKSLG